MNPFYRFSITALAVMFSLFIFPTDHLNAQCPISSAPAAGSFNGGTVELSVSGNNINGDIWAVTASDDDIWFDFRTSPFDKTTDLYVYGTGSITVGYYNQSSDLLPACTITYAINNGICADAPSIAKCAECNPTCEDCPPPTITANPDLTASCQDLQIAFILDESGSMRNFTNEVKDGVLAFLSSLNCTGAEVIIYEFNAHNAPRNATRKVVASYTAIDNNLIADMTQYFDGTGTETYTPESGTNWENAIGTLNAAIGDGDNDSTDGDDGIAVPDLTFFLTDGNPTATDALYDGTDQFTQYCQSGAGSADLPDIVNAMLEANILKGKGSHFFTLGVGGKIDFPNLKRISGGTEYDPSSNSIGTADYALEDFAQLAECLETFAFDLCPLIDPKCIAEASCDGEDSGSISFGVQGEAGVVYDWSINTTPIQAGQLTAANTYFQTINDLAPGDYTVTISETKADGCERSQDCEVTVGNNPLPTCTANNDGPLTCLDTEVTLTGIAGAASYSWVGPDGFTASGQTTNVTKPGEYTLFVTDDNGCESECKTTVLQTADNDPPTFTSCPSETIVLTDCGDTPPDDQDIIDFVEATDDCGLKTVIVSAGTISSSGTCTKTQTFTVTATDNLDNETTCEVTYQWTDDNMAPTFVNCPTEPIELGCATPPSNSKIKELVGATDDCGLETVWVKAGEITGDCQKTQTFTVTARDNCGLKTTCDVTYTWLDDNTPPTFANCPTEPIDLGCASPPSNSEIKALVGATDNCGLKTYWVKAGEITGDCQKSQTFTVTAKDNCNLKITCDVTYTWTDDNTAPTFANCPTEPIDLGCGNTPPSKSEIKALVGATDNCGLQTYWVKAGEITGDCQKTQTFTVTAKDNCNLKTTCDVTYTWTDDNTAPTFANCPTEDIILACGATPPTELEIKDMVGATDDCGLKTVSITAGAISGDCFKAQSFTITAEDKCGLKNTCVVTYKWPDDATPPTFTNCPTEPIVLEGCHENGPSEQTIKDLVGATDDCGLASLIITPGDISGNCNKEQSFTIVATNDCGLSTSCTVTYQWCYDVEDPVIIKCPSDITVHADETCEATVTWDPIKVNDNCGISGYTRTHKSGDTFQEGETTVTYVIKDHCGNEAICSFKVTVLASSGLTCPDDIEVACQHGTEGACVTWDIPTFSSCVPGNCPDDPQIAGFVYMGEFMGHRYYCSEDKALWEDAKTISESYGGYLTSIGTYAEQDYLENLIQDQIAFIGLSDSQTEGSFEWADGGNTAFTNWHSGVTNTDSKDYVALYGSGGKWITIDNNSMREYIMEVPCGIEIEQTAGPGWGELFPPGTTTVSYQATDSDGNTSNCSFDVTVSCPQEQEYCEAKGNSSYHFWINKVKLNGRTITSGSNGGYADITQYPFTVHSGGNYSLMLQPAYRRYVYNLYWRVFVDWNDDGNFSAAESVIATSGQGTRYKTLTIPHYVSPGPKRMRILMSYGGYAPNACCQFSYGEVEDYTINILSSNYRKAEDITSEEKSMEATDIDRGVALDDLVLDLDTHLNTELNVYPNPAFRDINITIPMTPSREFKLSVFNTTGIQVLEKDIEAMEGDVINLNELDHLTNGVYFIKLIGEDGMTTSSKFILQRE